MYIYSNTSSEAFYDLHMKKALNYIHNNYSYDIKISGIADYLNIDRTYLYKLFMTYVKASPLQYLISYRVRVSKKLLTETEL
jgi:YesN/AraC family two-component response regulator